MTTVYPFTPVINAVPPFAFSPTLDGAVCNASCTWNVYSQRWYLQVSDLAGNLIFNRAIVGSLDGVTIASLTYDVTGVDVITAQPHGWAVGTQVEITISGAVPDGYNGTFIADITSANSLTYPLANYPGQLTSQGAAFYNVNLAWSYFQTSTLLYRNSTNSFEVSP